MPLVLVSIIPDTRQYVRMYVGLYAQFFLLSSEIFIQPPSSLQTSDIRKRRVSYRFSASPTSGVTHKVAFIPLRTGIPQPQNKTFHKSRAGSRKMTGLTPDVTYRLQVAAVLGDVESTAISVNFTTKPDGKTAMTAL